MLGRNYFFNRTLRKIVSTFGSLFTDIVIRKYSRSLNKDIALVVPVRYAPKEKFYVRYLSNPDLLKDNIARVFPIIGYEMTGMAVRSSEKINQLNKVTQVLEDGSMILTFSPIPMNYDFTVSICSDLQYDIDQILEQVVSNFIPEFIPTIQYVDDIDLTAHDTPIVLNSCTKAEDNYDTDFTEKRVIVWELQYTVKGFMYGATSYIENPLLIKKTDADLLATANEFCHTINGGCCLINEKTGLVLECYKLNPETGEIEKMNYQDIVQTDPYIISETGETYLPPVVRVPTAEGDVVPPLY